MRDTDVRLSKAMSRALRHRPDLYELELDEAGWTPLDALLDALRPPGGAAPTRDDVRRVVATSAKDRFEVDGDRVRARYGHSVPGRIALTPGTPPDVLYHGTSRAAAGAIAAAGLVPMRRQYVHLSVDVETARQVGGRKDRDPVLLEIDAAAAVRAGVRFWRGNDTTWLALVVPAAHLRGLPPA